MNTPPSQFPDSHRNASTAITDANRDANYANQVKAQSERCWTLFIALQQIDGLGPVGLSQLIDSAGSVGRLMQGDIKLPVIRGLQGTGRAQLKQLLHQPENSEHWGLATRSLNWLRQTGSGLLCRGDKYYPRLLEQLSDCPPWLYINGRAEVFNKDAIAIVGARKPSAEGVQFTEQLAAELADAGLLVVSGMARGIDTAAHKGALQATGVTAAVWATGLDLVYPRSNQQLAEQIVQQGCVISEMPLGTRSLAGHFPRRNRLVSGICMGVIVVQAKLPSGSLITANYAAEQNREVFAVPGSVSRQLNTGCHHLIKDGATLVESAADVLEEINGLRLAHCKDKPCYASQTQRLVEPIARSDQLHQQAIDRLPAHLSEVLDAIGYDPAPYELIEARLANRAEDLAASLIDLELQGLLTVTGGLYSRPFS